MTRLYTEKRRKMTFFEFRLPLALFFVYMIEAPAGPSQSNKKVNLVFLNVLQSHQLHCAAENTYKFYNCWLMLTNAAAGLLEIALGYELMSFSSGHLF